MDRLPPLVGGHPEDLNMDLAKVVVGLLVGVFFWIGVAAGGGGVAWFDRQSNWVIHIPRRSRVRQAPAGRDRGARLPARPGRQGTRHGQRLQASAETQRGRCDANLRLARETISNQTDFILRLGREGQARVAVSEKASAAARAVAESERVHIQALLAAKPQSSNLCEAAEALIREEAEREAD